jgi:hypothetical protein
VVFCSAKPKDAEALAERFGGKRLSVTSREPEGKRAIRRPLPIATGWGPSRPLSSSSQRPK